MAKKESKVEALSPTRQRLQSILQVIEKGILFIHVAALMSLMLVLFVLPTKLFLGFVGLHNEYIRDYWFLGDNSTGESGIYGPLFSVLGQDVLWILQIYIPALLPFVLISFFIRRREGGETLLDTLGEFVGGSLLYTVVAVVVGGVLGTIGVLAGYALRFALCSPSTLSFCSPEISASLDGGSQVLDVAASGILLFDLLLATSILLAQRDVILRAGDQKKWALATLSAVSLLLLGAHQSTELQVRVETGGSDEQVTAYAHHWRESVYERQDVLVVKKLRVRRSRGHILPHEDLVDGGAFEVGPGRVRPGWSMHFVDGNGQRYKPMDAFFHERPTGVSVHGRVIEVVYALKKDRPLKSGSAQVDVKRNRWKVRARDEFGGAEYLQVVPVSSEKHWGIRMSCFEPAGLSILVIATEKGVSFHQAMGQSAPELLYLHAMEKAQSLALMQDGFSTLFVNGEPRLRLEGCAPTDYEPTAIGTDGQRVSLNVLRKTIE